MKKYPLIYWLIFSTACKKVLEYRFNAVIQALYAIMYMVLLNVIIQVIFLHTDSLANWSKNEVLMLYSVVATMLNTLMFVCLEGFRKFVNHGIRNGELDLILTKPISPLFGASFLYPDISIIIPTIGIAWYGVYIYSQLSVTLINTLLFLLIFLISLMISYLSFAFYATSAFFVEKSGQLMEIITKSSDYSQYPMSIFPKSFQLVSFTILPIAFFGYVSTSFLLGKGSIDLFLYSLLFLVILVFFVNKAWSIGLKKYSSASS